MASSNIEILAYEDTPLGLLCLRRRKLLSHPGTMVTEITLNHEFLMSSYHTVSERQLAARAIEMNPNESLRVLVGGLGLGCTAREVLASDRVAAVEVVEFLPQVIDWLHRGLFPLAEELNADPRFSVTGGDVYERLAQPPSQPFDLILIDVDHAPEENLAHSNQGFYSEEGLRLGKGHLTPDGILGIWSYAESTPFAKALHNTFNTVTIEPVTFRNDLIDETTTDWLFFARD